MHTKSAAALLCCAMTLVSACSGSKSSDSTPTTSPKAASTTTSAPGGTDAAAGSDTVWLCRPGATDDPCRSDTTITEIAADGATTVDDTEPATDPPVDCFYVYPTVSTQPTPVANLDIDAEQIAVAKAQASRFDGVCRIYAPMYRQRTIAGIFGKQPTDEESGYAYDDVVAAWNDYLANFNDGRGVILIGHSQGTFLLTRLLAESIETDPATRKLLVSALLIGGNVTVADGDTVGGSFKETPVCTEPEETGCVVAYSSFSSEPDPDAMFGHGTDGKQVVCSNPAALGGGVASLHPAFVTGESLLGSVDLADTAVDTPWVAFPDRYTGECRSNATHTWLDISTNEAAAPSARPELAEPLGPTWGLHLVDVNIALGDLVALARTQADAWAG